jgi:DNA mismatch endonuclease (patch repair protein)
VANVERDRRKDGELARLGWLALHVWEHESPGDTAARLQELWRARTGRP